MHPKGFTLVELILIIGISAMLVTGIMVSYSKFYLSNQLQDANTQIKQALKQAREYSVSGYFNSSYGVHFSSNNTSNNYIIYKGSSFAERDQPFDRISEINKNISFASTTLSAAKGVYEINFSKNYGAPDNYGDIEILNNNSGESNTIDINSLGTIN